MKIAILIDFKDNRSQDIPVLKTRSSSRSEAIEWCLSWTSMSVPLVAPLRSTWVRASDGRDYLWPTVKSDRLLGSCWRTNALTWKNMANSVCLQKWVTGYPQWPRHGCTSSLPPHLRLGQGLCCCFFRALSQMAGLKWTRSPLSSMQFLLQTKTPRQDFLRICTLWLLVFLIAHPLACLRASSESGR